jgi:predicted nucleotidyltransferase
MKAKGPGQSALLLLDVIDILNKRRIPHAVIGAFAASFHGVVRASMDADAMISLQSVQVDFETLIYELRKAGLKASYRRGDLGDPVGAVVHGEDRFKNRVDLLMNIRGMTEAVFSRTIEAEFMGARIHLVGIEDFIAMKIFAGSPKDLNDAAGVLKVSRDRTNFSLLRELVQGYGKSALHRLETLWKEGASSRR